jgi:hypothetical protein
MNATLWILVVLAAEAVVFIVGVVVFRRRRKVRAWFGIILAVVFVLLDLYIQVQHNVLH